MAQSIRLDVECYSGFKAYEKPLRFTLGNRIHEVKEIIDRWYGPDYEYFKVKADDSSLYILKYNRPDDCWEVHFFSTSGEGQQ